MKDNKIQYGTVSRFIHWSMAVGFIWMMLTVILKVVADKTEIQQFFWSTHKAVGLLLLTTFFIRIIWSFTTLNKRPTSVSTWSKLGHIGLYIMMFLVPSIGLLRQYGSGKEFSIFGMTIIEGDSQRKIQWMVDLGSQFHGLLGWVFFTFIFLHIVMVIVHHKRGEKAIIKRML